MGAHHRRSGAAAAWRTFAPMIDSSTSLTLNAALVAPYVHLDSRALVLCDGARGAVLSAARFRWIGETFARIATEDRATRTQGDHVLGGFTTEDGVVLYAGEPDALVSVRVTHEAFATLRERMAA